MNILIFISLIIVPAIADIIITRRNKGKYLFAVLRSVILYPLLSLFITSYVDISLSQPKVYIQNGKYGFKTKKNIVVPAEYVSLDTVTRIFTYHLEFGPFGHEINVGRKELYLAGDSLERIDVYALKYKGFKDVMDEVIHQCDSLKFVVDTAVYCSPHSPKGSKYPVNMIVYFTGADIDTISYQGSKTLPELVKSPWINMQTLTYTERN